MRSNLTPFLRTMLLSMLCLSFQETASQADQAKVLWQIGTKDQNNAEFALAPKDHAKFKEDAFFVVGQSEARTEWSYVQPGPVDQWAGSRQHTFTIVFGFKIYSKSGAMPFNPRPS